MTAPAPTLLMIANFLSSLDGRRSYAEDLNAGLKRLGVRVQARSTFAFKPARLLDMIITSLGGRGAYTAALVELYSGQAFHWAEAASRAVRLTNKPLVVALHGGNLPRFAEAHHAKVRRVLQSADAVVAPSPYLRDAFSSWRSDITLIPNAIDLNACPARVRSAATPRLVWLRAFHAMYNPSMAIRVLERVSRVHPRAELAMYGVDKGDGTLAECKRVAQELGLQDRVVFAGVVPKAEVGRSVSKADIFLNTTNVDNTPVSVLEAMGCGLCVVSTNVGGVPHLLRHDVDSLLVDAGDTEAMSNAVLRVLAESELCQRLSTAAMTKAQEFGWDSILPLWLDLLCRVAGKSLVAEAC